MDKQQLQEQIVQLVQAAMGGDQQASQQIQQIMQAAQQGDQQAAQIAQMIQAVAQQMQGQQVQAAKFGAKLNYIRGLRGKCPEGTELQYFKSGGRVCSQCVAKQTAASLMRSVPSDPIEAFKCGHKLRKASEGAKVRKTVDIDAQDWEGESGLPVPKKKPVNRRPVNKTVNRLKKYIDIDAQDYEGEGGDPNVFRRNTTSTNKPKSRFTNPTQTQKKTR